MEISKLEELSLINIKFNNLVEARVVRIERLFSEWETDEYIYLDNGMVLISRWYNGLAYREGDRLELEFEGSFLHVHSKNGIATFKKLSERIYEKR